MRSVILLGFSTTGKSTLSSEITSRHQDNIDVFDTDVALAGYAGKRHIYDVYLDWGRQAAVAHVTSTEPAILDSIATRQKALLIVVGPFIPTRDPAWANFLNRVAPAVIYLKATPGDVYDDLLCRRRRYASIECRAGFGSWDDGVTTEYDVSSNAWKLVPRERAVENISNAMRIPIQRYEEAIEATGGCAYASAEIRNDGSKRESVIKHIETLLGLND